MLRLLIITFILSCTVSSRISHFLHLSDLHFDPLFNGEISSKQFCRTSLNERPSDLPEFQNCTSEEVSVRSLQIAEAVYENSDYGRYGCDSPQVLIESVLRHSKRYDPDFVIVTGDLVGHKLTQEFVLKAMEFSVSSIVGAFDVPIVVALGNDDFFPNYSRETSVTEWLSKIFPYYKPFLKTVSSQHSFLKGGYYYVDIGELRVIVLNTVLYSPKHNNGTDPDPSGQFDWLESTLKYTKNAYIIGHIPPASIVWERENQWNANYIIKYFQVISKYASVIDGQLFGHTHRDDFKLYQDDSGDYLFSLLLTPSISPNSYTNPAYRSYIYDTDGYSLIDYLNYYADLILANSSGVNWKLEYEYMETFNELNLSTENLVELYNNLRLDANLFNVWYSHYDTLFVADRLKFYCAIRFPVVAQFQECMDEVSRSKR